MMNTQQEQILNRFIKYAKVNTRSDESSLTIPSTPSQEEFTLKLKDEIDALGFEDCFYNPKDAYLTATIPSTLPDEDIPTVGFIAHVDTADYNAENIQPQVIENYDGGDILLNEEEDMVLSPKDFPRLKHVIGHTLVTTDGRTLLGADDKAGITSIVTFGEYLINHPEIPHGKIRVAFGPDEEIGTRGAKYFDIDQFGADFAYTIDGGRYGTLTYENFYAKQANVTISGRSVHPGAAKDSMINALLWGARLATSLPADQVPEKTSGREGFYFLIRQEGTIDHLNQFYYLRDHDKEKMQEKLAYFEEQVARLNQEIGEERITYRIVDQYDNMYEVLKDYPWVIDLARDAYLKNNVEAFEAPMRGGTDGAILSHKGLPTPNLFSGAENTHGPYEFVTIETIEQSIAVLIDIAKNVRHYSA